MLIHGNSFRIPLKDNSVNCAISSYPYFGLRMYDGVPATIWGGDSSCQHIWGEKIIESKRGSKGTASGLDGTQSVAPDKVNNGQFCQLCNAWLGCFGLEPTISCENPGGGGLFELKDDLTDDERAFVISELVKLGIIR